MKNDILNKVQNYYDDKIRTYGATPQGVDWNGKESQYLRFNKLFQLIDNEPLDSSFSLLDYGCGYGEMIDYLYSTLKYNISYSGYDISEEMISKAKERYQGKGNFINKIPEGIQFDYVLASGIFNVKQNYNNDLWFDYIIQVLKEINTISIKGFSFNILTSYSDSEYMKEYLYYASPEQFFTYCKNHFSKKVSLLHDYPLYEFTILVKKI